MSLPAPPAAYHMYATTAFLQNTRSALARVTLWQVRIYQSRPHYRYSISEGGYRMSGSDRYLEERGDDRGNWGGRRRRTHGTDVGNCNALLRSTRRRPRAYAHARWWAGVQACHTFCLPHLTQHHNRWKVRQRHAPAHAPPHSTPLLHMPAKSLPILTRRLHNVRLPRRILRWRTRAARRYLCINDHPYYYTCLVVKANGCDGGIMAALMMKCRDCACRCCCLHATLPPLLPYTPH